MRACVCADSRHEQNTVAFNFLFMRLNPVYKRSRDYNVAAHPTNQIRGGRGLAARVKDGGAEGAPVTELTLRTSTRSELLHGVDPPSFISFLNKVAGYFFVIHSRLAYIAFILFKTCWEESLGSR